MRNNLKYKIDLRAVVDTNPLVGVVGAVVKLHRAGAEWKACCPFHAEKSPSFTIYSGGKRYQCFGCGAQGDVLDFIQRHHGVTLPEAASMLSAGSLPVVEVRVAPAVVDCDKERIAVDLWRRCGPIAGTPAEAYLRSRAITIALPDCLRFGRIPFGHRGDLPALVALLAGPDDKPCGVQRIFLTEKGAKADLPGGKVKFSLGRVRGAAVRVSPGAVSGMILAGSVEDGLSLIELEGRAVWASPGEEMLSGMELPEAVRSVVIGADADDAGRRFAAKARDRFIAEGRDVRVIYPAGAAKDFNQELQEGQR